MQEQEQFYEQLKKNLKVSSKKERDALQKQVLNLIYEEIDKDADEEEFGIEMQLPFIAKVIGIENCDLIPIMVGSLDQLSEKIYANLLYKYFAQPDTLFVISTDFCHWGEK